MAETSIEWTDKVWNPIRGCSRISTGCVNCYAEHQAIRQSGPGGGYEGLVQTKRGMGPVWTGKVRLVPEKLEEPLHWRKPARIFVNSMSDLFHEALPDEAVLAVFNVMRRCHNQRPGHVFQVLTKRAARMADLCRRMRFDGSGEGRLWLADRADDRNGWGLMGGVPGSYPLPNVWLGVSVENQAAADERIPHLLSTPAAVRFLSVEPLVGPVDLSRWIERIDHCGICGAENEPQKDDRCPECGEGGTLISTWGENEAARYRTGERYSTTAGQRDVAGKGGIDWVIVGGESGPGARPCDVAWVRSVVHDCKEAGVPCFVKQLGARAVLGYADPKPSNHIITRFADAKGGEMSEWPEDLRVRQFPEVHHD